MQFGIYGGVRMLEKWKKQGCLWLCLLLLSVGWNPVRADEGDAVFSLHARSAVLMDGDSGRILYGKEADTPLAMASTTKIMTCILALEFGSEAQICTASANAIAQPQVKLGMREGEQFYLHDLLYSLMLESHNDTAVCIAESVAGSVGAFSRKMNEKAAKIGCVNTCFMTPNGLDAGEEQGEWHHTTAADLAAILRYCITESPKAAAFLAVTRTASYSFSNIEQTAGYDCVNHNTFLTMMDGALTGKTGFTAKAGYCYVGALRDGERLYIVSLLACGWPGNKSWKWSDTRRLMEYGLGSFHKKTVEDDRFADCMLPVEGGKEDTVPVRADTWNDSFLMRDTEQITRQVFLNTPLMAPVKAGEQVGSVHYCVDGKEVTVNQIRAAADVEAADGNWYMEKILRQFFL